MYFQRTVSLDDCSGDVVTSRIHMVYSRLQVYVLGSGCTYSWSLFDLYNRIEYLSHGFDNITR